MLVLTGYVTIKSEMRDEFLAVVRTLIPKSRADAGCIEYTCYEDVTTANRFVFVERWESHDALKAHLASAHVKVLFDLVPNAVTIAPMITTYDYDPASGVTQYA
jgi:quinol monooxygenase YgiN